VKRAGAPGPVGSRRAASDIITASSKVNSVPVNWDLEIHDLYDCAGERVGVRSKGLLNANTILTTMAMCGCRKKCEVRLDMDGKEPKDFTSARAMLSSPQIKMR